MTKPAETLPAAKESPQSSSEDDESNTNQFLLHLGHEFDFGMTLEDLVRWISASEDVTSLFMAVEAIATWRQHNIKKMLKLRPIVLIKLYERLKNLAKERGWPLFPQQLQDYIFFFTDKQKVVDWFTLSQICVPTEVDVKSHVILKCLTKYDEPFNALCSKSKLVFQFEHPAVAPCKQLSECGFILETIPKSKYHLNCIGDVMLCTDKREYVKEDMHMHDVINVDKMHLCFISTPEKSEKQNMLLPLSWLGWITRSSLEDWMGYCGFYYKDRTFAVLYDITL